jgi:hypothetical protein
MDTTDKTGIPYPENGFSFEQFAALKNVLKPGQAVKIQMQTDGSLHIFFEHKTGKKTQSTRLRNDLFLRDTYQPVRASGLYMGISGGPADTSALESRKYKKPIDKNKRHAHKMEVETVKFLAQEAISSEEADVKQAVTGYERFWVREYYCGELKVFSQLSDINKIIKIEYHGKMYYMDQDEPLVSF